MSDLAPLLNAKILRLGPGLLVQAHPCPRTDALALHLYLGRMCSMPSSVPASVERILLNLGLNQ